MLNRDLNTQLQLQVSLATSCFQILGEILQKKFFYGVHLHF